MGDCIMKEVTYNEFIEGFKKYISEYGYEHDEIRPLRSWMRDYIAYRESEYEEKKINDNL